MSKSKTELITKMFYQHLGKYVIVCDKVSSIKNESHMFY